MASPPSSPVSGSPARRDGSVRRTSHIDMEFATGDDGLVLHLRGRARDLVTESGGRARAAGEAAVEAAVRPGFGANQRLVALRTEPARDATAGLVGVPVMAGFRRTLEEALPHEAGTTLGLLLDELPVATLISGYASLRSAALAGRPPPGAGLAVPAVADRMSDLCSGWRADGIAMVEMRTGGGLPVQECPAAPSLSGDDPAAWHDQPSLPAGAMRRRRRIDVTPASGDWAVDAMFRDTYGEPAGHEGVLHEYTLTATVAPDLTLRAIAAQARVLPFPECPWAAANVARLVGLPVRELRAAVPKVLGGIDGCTHLNDLLRALSDVAWLVRPEQRLTA